MRAMSRFLPSFNEAVDFLKKFLRLSLTLSNLGWGGATFTPIRLSPIIIKLFLLFLNIKNKNYGQNSNS